MEIMLYNPEREHLTVTREAYNKDKIFVGVTILNDRNDNPVLITDYKYSWSEDYDSVEILVSRYDLENRPNRVWRKLENAIINIYGNMTWADRRKQIRRRKMRAAEMAKKIRHADLVQQTGDQQITTADFLC